MRFLLAAILLFFPLAAQADQFSLRCDDGEYTPLLFTFDMKARKAIYESPAQESPLPGTITRSLGKSFLFSVQGIGPDFTDFVWNEGASEMQIGLRGTPFQRTFRCAEIPLRPVANLFETLFQRYSTRP
jgi:hypothetical protein